MKYNRDYEEILREGSEQRLNDLYQKHFEAIMNVNLSQLAKNREIKKGKTTGISVTGEDL